MNDNCRDFLLAMDAALSATQHADLTAILDSTVPLERYVVGRNSEAKVLAETMSIAGILDDWYPHPEWHGLPVIRVDEAPRDAAVFNCVTSISPVAVGEVLASRGFTRIVKLSDVIGHPSAPANLMPWFVKDQRSDFEAHRGQWGELYEALADEESRRTLRDVLAFRLTANPDFMTGYKVRPEEQYFENFLDLEAAAFVDAGGFDGDTTQAFCDRYPNYKKIFLVEPSPFNMAKARERLDQYRDISFLELGLSDKPGVVAFDASAGSASAVRLDGAHEMRVAPLDQVVLSPITFLKMDLEGWEMPALRGASGHIEEDQPELAIAVYHQASDFRNVFTYCRHLLPRHKVRLRHYTQGWSETVLYFVKTTGLL